MIRRTDDRWSVVCDRCSAAEHFDVADRHALNQAARRRGWGMAWAWATLHHSCPACQNGVDGAIEAARNGRQGAPS